jgi:DNA-directed RNA polymerase subunit RPC12/RpoP
VTRGANQPTLFDMPPKPRAKRRVLMHVVDAGPFNDEADMVLFECFKCGHETDWMTMRPSEAKRGIPCPNCNH